MRHVERLRISKDEIVASSLDLVSRAKNEMMCTVGHKLLSAYPSLVTVQDNDTVDVVLDMVVFSTADFHAGIQHMSEVMSKQDFAILIETMNLKELPNE